MRENYHPDQILRLTPSCIRSQAAYPKTQTGDPTDYQTKLVIRVLAGENLTYDAGANHKITKVFICQPLF